MISESLELFLEESLSKINSVDLTGNPDEAYGKTQDLFLEIEERLSKESNIPVEEMYEMPANILLLMSSNVLADYSYNETPEEFVELIEEFRDNLTAYINTIIPGDGIHVGGG